MKNVKNIFSEYKVFCGELSGVDFSRKTVVNTINQYSFCIAEQDSNFKNALISSDILLPDGIGIVVAIKSTLGTSLKKISGTDLHNYLINELNKNSGSCFYLGSSKNTLEKISNRIKSELPNIKVNYFSPPFKDDFSKEENEEMVQKINESNPDVLFVGMTAPKQEKWVNEHKYQVNAKIVCSIGAVFDFYAGTVKRPKEVWINLGLEWFIRLCKEPKRMWKRYMYYGPIFMYKVVKEIAKNDFITITTDNHD
ncbi:WecB/TagA/CpsF family glycosyltransferase [Mucilaginibacter sp. UYCu711]|uniref:WecB/TagA/CpsF family glycosyltransferase n=1 Tax=Mucilaginibacter sp. UYCu711 TaxID=3156339 RepID=UPI003D1C325E